VNNLFFNTLSKLHPVQRRRWETLATAIPVIFPIVLIAILLLYDASFLRATTWAIGICLIAAAIVLLASAVIVREISGRRLAERALRQNEERLRQIVRVSQIGIFDHDHLTGEIYWSPEMRHMFNCGPHEKITFADILRGGRPSWNAIHPDDRPRVHAARDRAHQTAEGPFDIEYRILCSDGTQRWVSNRSQTFFEGKGPARRAVRTIGAVQDITEHKQAERQLKLTQTSIDRSSVAIYWVNSKGLVTYVNQCACQSLGLTLQELIGQHVWDFDPDMSPEAWVDVWREIKERKLVSLERRHRRKDGTLFPVEVTGTYVVFEGEEHTFVFVQDITQRERAERELRMMLAAIDTCRTPFYSIDSHGRVIYANEHAWLTLGRTREELIGSYVWDFDPDFRPEYQDDYWRDVRKAGELRFETRHCHKDGTVFPVMITANFFSYKGDQYSLVFAQDISERKRAEEALAMFRHSIDRASDPIFWLNRFGGFDYVNDEACRCLGYSREELLRLHLWDISATYPKERWSSQWERWEFGDQDAVEYVEGIHRRKDGTLIPVEVKAQHIWYQDGRSLHVAYARNISERKSAAQAIRSSEERLRQVALVYHIGVFDFDHITHEQYWSPQLRMHAGVGPSERPDESRYIAAIHPEDRPRVAVATRRAFDPAGDGHFEIQHRVLAANGSIRWLESRSQTYFEGEGSERHPVRTVGATVDITERVAAEEALKESLREKETLLREVHHRVKNNLQIIASLLHFQAKKIKDPEDLAAFFEGRDRLRSMILVHEKLYQSRGLARIDFGNYLQSLAGELQRSYGARSGRRVDVRITADEIALPIESALPCGMIICELLTNIFKYAFPGGRDGGADIQLATADGHVSLIVSDDGVGLPQGFDPRHSTSFGWQLINNLARQLGGTMDVVSRNGTRVAITFPVESGGH
jgi:PAS domain S-box-containing protein